MGVGDYVSFSTFAICGMFIVPVCAFVISIVLAFMCVVIIMVKLSFSQYIYNYETIPLRGLRKRAG